MNAMPIIRVSRSGVGACRRATSKASIVKKRIALSRMVRRAYLGSSRQSCPGVRFVWRMKVPPSARPLSGLVWMKALWSGAMTTSTSSSSAFVRRIGSGLRVM